MLANLSAELGTESDLLVESVDILSFVAVAYRTVKAFERLFEKVKHLV